MLEAMDHHIGRLIAHLKRTGKFENTIFILTSDNGPEPSDPVHAFGMNYWMATHGYDWRLENLGEKGSLGFIGPEWAASISSPGKLFKFYTSEGGLHVPFIISGPGIKPATRPSAPAFVTDVAPTILDLAGVAVSPAKGEVPITGKSLRPVLAGTADRTHAPDATVGFEVAGNAALFKGDFKIAKYAPPHGDNEWHLFNLATDPGEAVDLSKSDPERLATMIADYRAYEARMGVLELPPGYNVQKQVLNNAITRQLQAYWWVLLALTIAVAALGYGAWRFVVPMIRARLR
jgi:arylsulfatase/uncharacterized sulfatase